MEKCQFCNNGERIVFFQGSSICYDCNINPEGALKLSESLYSRIGKMAVRGEDISEISKSYNSDFENEFRKMNMRSIFERVSEIESKMISKK